MFQSGMNPVLGTTFMASTIMIAVPSAIKTFNWLGTLWGGNIRFTPPMLNALAFVSMFVIGGLSGIFMASAPVDIHIHDTYFIVAHIHYVLFGGSMFGIFAGVYYWFPKMFGRNMNQRWGHIHFWMTFIAFNLTFFTMHILGVGGHPRRYASIMEYPTLQHLQPMNVLMTLGALMLGMAQIPFLFNFFVSLPRKLGRAMTALFIVALGIPAVMGLTYKAIYKSGPYAAESGEMIDPYWNAIGWSFGAGAIYIVAVVAVVFALWWLGGVIRMPRILGWLMYPLFLPLFLMPLFVKPDAYYWLGIPELAPRTWLAVLVPFVIFALPGLLYVVLRRPRDEFGEAVGDNPWQANSLEWCTSSPPPFTNFHEIPTVYRGPYEYSSPVVDEDFLPQPHRLPPGVIEPAGH
jgi:heme/copper-type cytochrome/quinol oxidase subunit 1